MIFIKAVGLGESRRGKLSLYSLRHTYITNQIIAGVPLTVIATQCGTSDHMLAQHYNHAIPLNYAAQLVEGSDSIENQIKDGKEIMEL